MSHTINALLSCGCHRILVAPVRLGQQKHCTEHGVVRVTSNLPEFYIKCLDCRYGRKYGQARLTAEVKATSHGMRLKHRVQIWHGNKLLETTGRGYDQPPLPEMNDAVIRGGPKRLRKLHEQR